MSIVTRTGDSGSTGLMYNRRVPKSHARVEAYGTVDELNATLGVARAAATHDFVRPMLLAIQKDLVLVMGELATHPSDLARYLADGFQVTGPEFVTRLDQWVIQIEAQGISYKGWATPGATPEAAALDVARTTCRRAERRIHALHDAGEPPNPEILIFLNRLSDLLWLLARWVETHADNAGPDLASV